MYRPQCHSRSVVAFFFVRQTVRQTTTATLRSSAVVMRRAKLLRRHARPMLMQPRWPKMTLRSRIQFALAWL